MEELLVTNKKVTSFYYQRLSYSTRRLQAQNQRNYWHWIVLKRLIRRVWISKSKSLKRRCCTLKKRHPDRIEKISCLIRKIWESNPDMRFFQLLDLLKHEFSLANDGFGKRQVFELDSKGHKHTTVFIDLFYLEDDDLEEFLLDYIESDRKNKEWTRVLLENLVSFVRSLTNIKVDSTALINQRTYTLHIGHYTSDLIGWVKECKNFQYIVTKNRRNLFQLQNRVGILNKI